MTFATDLPLTSSPVPGELERRRQVRLRLRPNLVFAEQRHGGRTFQVVKDPVSLRYFRLDEGQYFAIRLLDGQHTLDDIQQAYERRFRPDRLSLEELEAFGNQLLHSGLAENLSRQAGPLLLERVEQQQRQRWWLRLFNGLSFRLPLADPDRLLQNLLPVGRVLFDRRSLLLVLPFLAASLGLVAVHWQTARADFPILQEFGHWHWLLGLAVGWIGVKALHELGHGLCCKTFGGEVHELGVGFLAFFPAPYCNVTDSWTFASKWQRIAVNVAGVYLELLLAAAACWVWWLTDRNSPLHQMSFGVMILCSVRTVLGNANPLLRLDGYYVLTDWLEVPDLAENANRHLEAKAIRWLGVETPAPETPPGIRPLFLIFFAAASYVFRWLLLVLAACWLYAQLKPLKLGSFSYLFSALALTSLLAWPAYRLARFLQMHGRMPDVRWRRASAVLVLLAAFGVAVFLIPLPMTVRGLAVVQVEPERSQRVVVPDSGGFLQEILVKDGQRVRAGDILAVLSNPRLNVKLRVNEAETALRLQQQHALIGLANELGLAESKALESLPESDFDTALLQQQHKLFQEQRDRLILRAPCAGIVVGLVSLDDKGKWLDKGADLCAVGDDQALRALVLIEAADHCLVTPGSTGWIRVHGSGNQRWGGRVTALSQVEAKNIPPHLTERLGGDVATKQDPQSRAEKPNAPHYLVSLHLQEGADTIQPGVLGRVKLVSRPQTLWWRAHCSLATTFNWGL